MVDVRTSTGGNAGSVSLDAAIFGIEPNVPVMHQVVVGQLASKRAGTQSTLTRAEVRGGGAKPWRQKGSGRARQGSTRAPHWKGGGVALGPKPRSYKQRTPKKMVQLALRSALSDRASENRVAVVESWDFPAPRTKDARAALDALGLTGRVLDRPRPQRGERREVVPQPADGADHPGLGAERLRRALLRLDRLHPGQPAGPARARPTSPTPPSRRRPGRDRLRASARRRVAETPDAARATPIRRRLRTGGERRRCLIPATSCFDRW